MNWILSQIDVKGRRIYEKIGENPPSVGCAVCWYGDWGFYLTLLYFSMAVPYAYLGFKATNKSKRKPEMELFSNSVFFWRERKICYEGIFTIPPNSTYQSNERDIFLKYYHVCTLCTKIWAHSWCEVDGYNLSFWHMSIKIYHSTKPCP